MTCSWPTVTLDECASFQEGYVNPTQKKEHYFDGPVKWLRAVDLNNGSIRNTSRTLSEEGFKSAGKSALLFEPGTLAISKSGTIGRIGILEDYMCGNRAVINIKVDKDKCDNLYIFYVLLMSRRVIETLAVGSVQKNLYTSALGSLELRLPPLQVQAAIAKQLSDLDKKIDLNTQTNQTLEEMAQAIFKSWFVDFDPVKAKMNGKQPEGMDAATASLFPEKLVESELGLIPEGWEVKSLGEVSTFQNGFAFKSKELTTDSASATHKVFKMGNIRKGGGFNSKGSKDYFDLNSNPKVERYLIKKGDLLMSMTDMKNNVALLGHTALMPVSDEYLVNQRVGLIRKSDKHYLDSPFLYYQTNEPLFITDVRSRANSGVQVNLSTKGIKDTLLVVPPKEIHDAFDKQVRAFLEMIFTNDQQSEELASIRDLLLPKLLSGEIELGTSEELVEAI